MMQYLLTQTEVAKKLGVTKQYISYLTKSEKIKKTADNKIDYYEAHEFLEKKKNAEYEKERPIDDDLKDKFRKEKYFINWDIENISKNEFINFIVNNFNKFYSDYTSIETNEKLTTIGNYIYYYQLSYEKKPTTEAKKTFDNQLANDKNKFFNHVDALIMDLDPVFANSYIKNLEELKINYRQFIKYPDYVPEMKISKKELTDNIKFLTSPKDSLLLKNKKCNQKIIKDEQYSHNYEIDKILKALPF